MSDNIAEFKSTAAGKLAPTAQQPYSPMEVAVGLSSMRNAKKSGNAYHIFKLTHTGGIARVKRPSMFSMAAIRDGIPNHIASFFKSYVTAATSNELGKTGSAAAKQVEKELETNPMLIVELASATVIVGFVSPRVVDGGKIVNPMRAQVSEWPGSEMFYAIEDDGWKRADAHGNILPDDTVFLDEIEVEDRIRYFNFCQSIEQEEAKPAASFPKNESE